MYSKDMVFVKKKKIIWPGIEIQTQIKIIVGGKSRFATTTDKNKNHSVC